MSQTTGTIPALRMRRTFHAPRERVFAAWTDPQQLRAWMGGPDVTVQEAVADVREGGTYRIAMLNPNGETYVTRGRYTEVRPPERLAFTWAWEEDDPSEETEAHITVELIDRDGDTEMVFTHEHFASDASRANHEDGWTKSFDKLGTVVGG